MKYKGIELTPNSEAELLISVEYTGIVNGDELEEEVDALEESLEDIINYDNCELYVEHVTDTLFQIRSDCFTFDEKGIEIIKVAYDAIKNEGIEDIKISIGIHVDADEWFKDEQGHEYNEDVAETWKEFIENLEV